MRTPPKIGLDLDGVCAQWDGPFARLLTDLTGRPCPGDEPTCWDWPRAAGFSDEDERRAWAYINDNPTWWDTLVPYADSFVDFRSFERAGWDIYFITARRTPLVRSVSAAWLKRNYLIDHPTVLLSSEKGLLCKALKIDAFIDDRPSMAVDVKLTTGFTRTYLRTRLHNTDDHEYLTRNNIILIDSVQAMFDRELERISK